MQETQFLTWLCEKYTGGTPNSRLSNCQRVEQYEGNLDNHYSSDKGASLLRKLSYSKDDQRNNRKAAHKISIDGNTYNGTATLKQAVNLYFKFKSGVKHEKLRNSRTPTVLRKKKVDWPVWEYPNDEELYEIIKLTVKYIKFLAPEIIQKIADDNIKHSPKRKRKRGKGARLN